MDKKIRDAILRCYLVDTEPRYDFSSTYYPEEWTVNSPKVPQLNWMTDSNEELVGLLEKAQEQGYLTQS